MSGILISIKMTSGSISWATDVLNKNSWHRTGDLGYKDELDRIWLVGRKAHKVRLIDGNTLYTKQVEQFLDSSLNIRTALVNGPSNLKPVIVVEKQEQNWIILEAKLRQKIPKLCKVFNIDSDFIFIKIKPLDGKTDVVGGKLMKAFKHIKKQMVLNDFTFKLSFLYLFDYRAC